MKRVIIIVVILLVVAAAALIILWIIDRLMYVWDAYISRPSQPPSQDKNTFNEKMI